MTKKTQRARAKAEKKPPIGHEPLLLFRAEPWPHEPLGEVGRRCDQEEGGDPVRPCARRQQREPAAHR